MMANTLQQLLYPAFHPDEPTLMEQNISNLIKLHRVRYKLTLSSLSLDETYLSELSM